MKKCTIVIFIILAQNIFAQSVDIHPIQKRINEFFEQIILEKNDSVKQKFNDSIKIYLQKIFMEENSFSIDLHEINYIGKITSQDNFFNTITWNIPLSDRMLFSGFIQRNDGRIFELIQSKSNQKPTEYQQINLSDWYGALYYRIVPFIHGKRQVYALAAWSRYQNDTEIKLIDVLDFQNNTIVFGLPVFENEDVQKFRAVFEYNFQSTMYLDYNSKKKRFEFDHISPMKVDYNNEATAFGVDMSVDGYKLKGEKWVLMEDLKVKNVKAQK